ncbi:unnamed protein product [Nezara viridula]|uniref:Uncharacterized protein n=1 Tax=Nezara viridula TaxID=85310 RepID=A0A9P0H316_NEZVI|nr:unnamed protein product [Nezara viridula]
MSCCILKSNFKSSQEGKHENRCFSCFNALS